MGMRNQGQQISVGMGDTQSPMQFSMGHFYRKMAFCVEAGILKGMGLE